MKEKLLTNEQVYGFCLALQHLIHAGISLGDALMLLKEDEKDPTLQKILEKMAQDADDGRKLSQILRDAECFPAYVCSLIRVAEQVGNLEQTLGALAGYYEARDRMDRMLRSAFLYPAVLMMVLLTVLVVLLVWVMPVFDDVYRQLGSHLTGIAGGLLALGTFLREGMPWLCLLVGVLAVVFAVQPLRNQAAQLWNRCLGDRGAMRKILSARYVQALTMALSSGMTEQEALLLAETLAEGETTAFCARCAACREAVEAGLPLSQALMEEDFLKQTDRRLLDAGKRSGKAEQVLEKISRDMLERSEDALQHQVERIEPVLVAFSCGLIGVVILSVMLPLMQIMTAIG